MTCVQESNSNGPCPNWTYTAGTNQLSTSSGFTYDAAGNVINDSAHTYQWDAEGHPITIDSGSNQVSNIFNALGRRAYWSKGSGTVSYWDDPWGQFLGGYWSPGSFNAAIPFAGRMLAAYTSGTTGPVYFDHPNALGSEGQWTTVAGGYNGEVLFDPWGQVAAGTANGFQVYASLLWYDTGNDGYQTPNRYYIPRHGRWLSPDPLGGDVTNPQSLDRYPYVPNNPTSLTDPLGLDPCNGIATVDCNAEEASQSNHGGGGWGTDPNDRCSYTDTVDASCAGPPGLWDNGEPIYGSSLGGSWGGLGIGGWGGGFGSGPLSGDFGPLGYPSAGGWGTPCEFGTCGPIWNPFTAQVGGAFNLNIWIFSFNFAGGFAIDFHGHIATYQTTGKGVTGGGAGSIGTQVSYSNADTVCGLSGPFWNASGTFGAGGAVSADVFQGKGNGPGGTVTGGGITAGAGAGAGGSVTRTNTDVTPIASAPCH